MCIDDGKLINYGHCGISLGNGQVINAWDKIRIDDYKGIEKLKAMSGDYPKYIGWVPLKRVLEQR